jgi:hypothetical protein
LFRYTFHKFVRLLIIEAKLHTVCGNLPRLPLESFGFQILIKFPEKIFSCRFYLVGAKFPNTKTMPEKFVASGLQKRFGVSSEN